MLKGYRTYLVSLGFIVYGILGFALGDMAALDAIRAGLEGLGLAGLRAAV